MISQIGGEGAVHILFIVVWVGMIYARRGVKGKPIDFRIKLSKHCTRVKLNDKYLKNFQIL